MTDTETIRAIALTALDRWHNAAGMFFVVAAPFDMDRDRPEIVGRAVTFDGHALWKVAGVERYAMGVPIRKGEKIGLRVVAIPAVPLTATEAGEGLAARAARAYRKSLPFRNRVELIVSEVIEAHGPIDLRSPNQDALRIARATAAALLQAVYEDDAELQSLKAERDAAQEALATHAWSHPLSVRLGPAVAIGSARDAMTKSVIGNG